MARQDRGPGARRPRSLRAVPGVPAARVGSDAPAPALRVVVGQESAPRVEALNALLRDVDELRSTLRKDLTLAATALESGEPALAGWLLDGDSDALHTFEGQASAHLGALEATPGPAPSPAAAASPAPAPAAVGRHRARFLAATPFVAAAAAVIGFVTGVVPSGSSGISSSATRSAALASYTRVYQLAATGAPAVQVRAAAQHLQDTLAPLLEQAQTDPAAAETAIALLQAEQVLLTDSKDHSQLGSALHAAQLLVSRLQARLPQVSGSGDTSSSTQGAGVPAAQQQSGPEPSSQPSSRPASPRPSPAAKPSSKPSHSASPAPRQDPSPAPSGQPNPLGSPVPNVP